MAMTDLTIVRRSMTARLFSTVTTIVTVAVAVALMLVLLSMRDSGQKAFSRGSGNMHLLISRDASPLVAVLNGVFYANAPRNYMEWAKVEEIAGSLPFDFAIPSQLGDSYRGLPVMAVAPELFTMFEPVRGRPWSFASGQAFTGPFQVVLGAEAARVTGLGLGSEIYLTHGRGGDAHQHRDYAYEVVGILESTGSAHDRALFTDLMSSWVVHAHDRRLAEEGSGIELTTADQVTEEDKKVTGIYARVLTRPGQDASAVLPQVFDMLRRDTSITVASPSNQIERLFQIVGNIDRIFIAMAGVVMISSGIGIMLALYNSMEQRRRQIAVMRVLGCSRGRVFGLVMTESAMIGLMGGVMGALLAVAGAQAVAAAVEARLGLVIEPAIGLDVLLSVIVATVLLASVAGLVPAVVGYRTSVVRHLRPVG